MIVKTVNVNDIDLSQDTLDYLLLHPMEIIEYSPSDYSDMLLMNSLIMSSYMEYEDLGDIDDSPVPTEALEDKVVIFKFSGKKNK